MRHGFTTGSCAAAAAKAAVYMLLSGRKKETIRIETPAGIPYEAALLDIRMTEDAASCAVRKDAGDDPDITDKALIYARAEALPCGNAEVLIEGGEGVGTVTRPGLDQPVGNAAINSVPRQMITREVKEVMEVFGFDRPVRIVISVPDGRRLAEKTFNPRLGIEGGISIIGTTGIVEPMSRKAIVDTIRVELNQKRAGGAETAVISPGNYGLAFMKEAYGYDLDKAVKCSNFIGETIDIIKELGFRKMVLCGHAGKLVKLSGGIMNTHSAEADCRMELMAAAAVRCGASRETALAVLACLTTEEACAVLEAAGIREKCFGHIMDRISFYLQRRAGDGLDAQCIVYSKEWGLLGATASAADLIKECADD